MLLFVSSPINNTMSKIKIKQQQEENDTPPPNNHFLELLSFEIAALSTFVDGEDGEDGEDGDREG